MGIFSNPKRWDTLTENGKAWAKKVGTKNADSALASLIGTDGVEGEARLRFLLANFEYAKSLLQKVILGMIRARQVEQVKVILSGVQLKDFLSSHSFSVSCNFLPEMLTAAAQTRDSAMWNAIQDKCGLNQHYYSSKFDAYHYLDVLSGQGWTDVAAPLFDAMKGKDGSFYGGILKQYSGHREEDLVFALQWLDDFNYKSANLARSLRVVAEKGEVAKAAILLDAGANPHADSGAALQAAVAGGHCGIIDLFIARGMNLGIFGQEILANLEAEKGGTVAYAYFRQCVAAWQPKAVAEEDRYSLSAIDTLAEKQRLPDGGTLTILFNFSLRQQMVLTDKANTVVSFDDIDPAIIERARTMLVAKDGKAEEVAMSYDKPTPANKNSLR